MRTLKGANRLGQLVFTPPYYHKQPPKGMIWFLHGTCDSGPGIQKWVKDLIHRDFNFYSQQVFYPTAASIPYDLMNGQETRVWFNRLKLSPDMPEDIASIESSATTLGKLIVEETERQGVPLSKVIVGGFSQGGSMALHLAYRIHPEVAGCFALSSFLPPDSKIYSRLEKFANNKSKRIEGEKQEDTAFWEKYKNLSKKTPDEGKMDKTTHENTSTASSAPSDASADTAETEREQQLRLPLLFMSHGTHDPLVLHAWGKSTFSKLTDHGVLGQFYTINKMDHTMNPIQLHVLHNWIERVLRDEPASKTPLMFSRSWPLR